MPRPLPSALAVTILVLVWAVVPARAVASPTIDVAGRLPGKGKGPEFVRSLVSNRAVAHYVRARLATHRGDHAAAARELRSAVIDDPTSPQLRVALAESLARQGLLEKAEVEARKAVGLAPPGAASIDARLALGKVLATARRTDAAVLELSTAAKMERERFRALPDLSDDEGRLDPEPWRALARARFALGDEEGAVDSCEQLAEFLPAESAAGLREIAERLVEKEKIEAAERRLLRAVELAPSDGLSWQFLARVLEARQRLPEARQAWERVVAIAPDDEEAILASGRLALQAGDLSVARAWFGQLVSGSPDELSARVRVGVALLEANRPEETVEVVGSGSDPRVAYLRGLALQQLRRWREAAAAFAVVEPDSDLYGRARVNLGHVLGRAGRPDEAVRALRSALDLRPGDPALLYALGDAHHQAGEVDEALRQMRAVLAVKSDDAEALNFIGYAYVERGERLEEAQALLERAVALDPGNGYYLDSLGWLHFRRGDIPRAISALERASALVGPEPTILEHLGDAYRLASRHDEARSAYRRALEAVSADEVESDAARDLRRSSVERKLSEIDRLGPWPTSSRK